MTLKVNKYCRFLLVSNSHSSTSLTAVQTCSGDFQLPNSATYRIAFTAIHVPQAVASLPCSLGGCSNDVYGTLLYIGNSFMLLLHSCLDLANCDAAHRVSAYTRK